MKVHFICRGNVLRSLIAETYLKSLKVSGITVISSGTNVHWENSQERNYFANTMKVLARHSIENFAKVRAEQLTQERLDANHDVVVFMNERVAAEAAQIVKLSTNVLHWNIVDIGEGHRTVSESRESYEEEIYQEITRNVDTLIDQYIASPQG